MHQINQSSRCSHNNLHTLFQGPHLRLNRSTTIDSLHVYAIHIFGEVTEIISYLQTKLTSWREYQGLRLTPGCINTLKEWDAESRSFSRTCLGKSYDIVLIAQQVRNHRLLDWHRIHKAQFIDSLAYRLTNA